MDLQLAPLPAPSGDQEHPATGHTATPSQPSTTSGWSLPAMNDPQQEATWTHGTRGGRWGCRLGCCLTVCSASWEEISMWFPVFCECFALCLLFNSCVHAQHFITYGCLMKTFLSCFWPQAFTMCFNPPFKQLLHMLAHCCPRRATTGVWYSSWGGNWGGGS